MLPISKLKAFADNNFIVAQMVQFLFLRVENIVEKGGNTVLWVTLFKNCLQNFDRSINMALVNGGFLHYTDMKKFLKKSTSPKPLVRFWNDFIEMLIE